MFTLYPISLWKVISGYKCYTHGPLGQFLLTQEQSVQGVQHLTALSSFLVDVDATYIVNSKSCISVGNSKLGAIKNNPDLGYRYSSPRGGGLIMIFDRYNWDFQVSWSTSSSWDRRTWKSQWMFMDSESGHNNDTSHIYLIILGTMCMHKRFYNSNPICVVRTKWMNYWNGYFSYIV